MDRLLRRPVFIIAPVRSGSTLLRMTLGAHSRLHAPHELHFRRLEVRSATRLAERSLSLLGLERADLEHLLWDRVLHRELVRSGKSAIVEKTPGNAFVYRRIAACWPDARFLFLLRHPASVARSWHEADPAKRDPETAAHDALRYLRAVDRARNELPGHTVRYEELTADPAAALGAVCEFLEIDWEPEMLDYGRGRAAALGDMEKGLGDWKDKIRTGRVQPGRELPAPDEVPEVLRGICAAWGYADLVAGSVR
ncbi:sulfotransferase [Streptomyces hoynatensis]|uniref:sulfotransferase family protein n=1 Tax=Streptomyces hoynatensis TaxID=1141874 RepID=UPI0030C84C39